MDPIRLIVQDYYRNHPFKNDNLIRGKDKLKEQAEYLVYENTRVLFTTYAYKLTNSSHL